MSEWMSGWVPVSDFNLLQKASNYAAEEKSTTERLSFALHSLLAYLSVGSDSFSHRVYA